MSSILETRHLRLVRALADEGGPTRAGARLHLSQSAVSHQLADLERRLGLQLFTRDRRRLKLTAAGQRLLDFSRGALGELDRVEAELMRSATRERTQLRISTECFTCYHWLPPVLPELRHEHPEVDVRIVIEATRRPIVALQQGKLDLAIVSTPVRDRSLVVERLFADEWVVIMAPTHPFARLRFVRALDLARQPLFTHDGTPRDVARLRSCLVAERAPMPDVQVVPLTEAIVELVKGDLGVGLVSRWAIAPYEARGEIVARRFTRAGLKESWSAVHRRDAAARLPLARLAALLRARAPGDVSASAARRRGS